MARDIEWVLDQHDKFLAKLEYRTMELLRMGAELEKRISALEKK